MPADQSLLEERAHAAAAALNRGDIDAYLELLHPEVEFSSLIAEADGEVFRGRDGARRWWEVVRNAFEQAHWEYRAVTVDDSGERGVAEVHISGNLGGVPVEQTMWQAVTMRDGLALWWAFFRTRDEAFVAAGLSA